jgi:taurine dioxygenase
MDMTTDRPAPEFKHFRITPCTPTIGGTIEGMHLTELTEESAAELRTALWHYGVLFAREQNLTPEQQKTVARYFGDELEKHSFGGALEGHPEVLRIKMESDKTGKLTTDRWHMDVTSRKHPNIMSVLQAEEVPFGADTMWASSTAAWDSLPYAMKLFFLNLDIEHDAAFMVLRAGFPRSGMMAARLLEQDECNTHPAVVQHPVTGRLCLYIGDGYIKRVHMYPTNLSEMIIKLANELPRTPEFQVRHQWRKGDVALWDNYGTWHYGVTSNLGDKPRLLHRVAAVSTTIVPTLDRARAMRELLESGPGAS